MGDSLSCPSLHARRKRAWSKWRTSSKSHLPFMAYNREFTRLYRTSSRMPVKQENLVKCEENSPASRARGRTS